MSERLRVGFVGLGTMGSGMARNIARAGFPLALFNRTASKAKAIAQELLSANGDVRAVETPAEVARRSDVVVSCLVHGAARGTVVIDCSTTAAEAARGVAARLRESGIPFLDAPVSGGQKGAAEGTLTFFVGADDAQSIERARPVFEAMGKRVTHLGPSGAGQLGKAANQILVACNLLAVSEAMAFARRVGLPLEALHGALTAGAAKDRKSVV